MDVILLENVARLGRVGNVVKVRAGYGRNYLVPQGKAVRATKNNLEQFETRRSALEKRDAEQKAAAETRAKSFAGVAVKIVRQASDDGKLFGSVTVRDVADALLEQGHEVERRHIDLSSGIRHLGRYNAFIVLHSDVRATINVDVVRSLEASFIEEDEAQEAEAADEENAA
jgi:large subunit ribosomal protein L9